LSFSNSYIDDHSSKLPSNKKDTFGLEAAEKWFQKLFKKKEKRVVLGIYGAPNAGKTTLANRIALDCNVEPKGVISEIPHETREVIKIENLNLNINGKNLRLTVLDTPVLATKISHLEFIKHGLTVSELFNEQKKH